MPHCPFKARMLKGSSPRFWPNFAAADFFIYLLVSSFLEDVTMYLKYFYDDCFSFWITQQIFCCSYILGKERENCSAYFFPLCKLPLRLCWSQLSDLSVSPVLLPFFLIYSCWLLMAGGKNKRHFNGSFVAALIGNFNDEVWV